MVASQLYRNPEWGHRTSVTDRKIRLGVRLYDLGASTPRDMIMILVVTGMHVRTALSCRKHAQCNAMIFYLSSHALKKATGRSRTILGFE